MPHSNDTTRAAIKELLRARTSVAQQLATQLEKYQAAKDAVAVAARSAADEAGKAREIYQQALEAGWTASELTSAGLKPPAPPRRRGGAGETDDAAAAD